MVCTVVIYRQMDYLQNKDLGFEKAGLIWFSFPNQDQVLRNQFEVLKQALMQSPHIVQVSSAGMMPFEAYGAVELTVAGEKVWLNRLMIDADFIETFGMTLISGRNFSRDATDRSALILNETAIKTFGMKGEMGEHPPWTESHQLIGVVKDFHLASLHTPIAPVALSLGPGRAGDKVIVRIQPEQATEALAFIKEKWEAFAPGYPFEVVFFDDIYEGKYHAEQRLKRLVTWFSLVAMFIAGLGLWGLAAFASERRIKEIGIRKVMGASVVGIVALLSKDFLKLVALAMGIAWAVAYYVMDLYLQGFAYRVILSMDIFLLCGLAALLIAQLTVSYQAVRAALTNLVDALRYE